MRLTRSTQSIYYVYLPSVLEERFKKYTTKIIFVVCQIYFTRQDFDSNNGYGSIGNNYNIIRGPRKLLPLKAFHGISRPQAIQ